MPRYWENSFPNLQPNTWRETSSETRTYNCIAWAAGDSTRWWWPDAMAQRYWPKGLPRIATLDNFIKAYESVGFQCCDDDSLEPGFEKIAIYVNSAGQPRHAARQLSNGKWTSKLGELVDIEHETPLSVISAGYGNPVRFMKRPLAIQ